MATQYIKPLRDFFAGGEMLAAGEVKEVPAEIAETALKNGWAEAAKKPQRRNNTKPDDAPQEQAAEAAAEAEAEQEAAAETGGSLV